VNDKISIIETIHILEVKQHPKDCKICSVIQCPGHNPYHLNKYGCPYCSPALVYNCLDCDSRSVDLLNGIEICNTCINKSVRKRKLIRY
jgi:hypothetical protein